MDKPVLLALHWQNDVLHPAGRIRVGMSADDPMRASLLEASVQLLAGARQRDWAIVQVRIAFRPDYADLARNLPIFRRTAELGAVREGDWGADFYEPLKPRPSAREFVLTHQRISAFAGTSLDLLLRQLEARTVVVAGVATHSVVEGTVRDAADRGYNVWVAADACACADRAAHAAALSSMALVADVSTVDACLRQVVSSVGD